MNRIDTFVANRAGHPGSSSFTGDNVLPASNDFNDDWTNWFADLDAKAGRSWFGTQIGDCFYAKCNPIALAHDAGVVSDVAGTVAIGCALLVLAAGAGLACMGVAAAVSTAAGGVEVAALWAEQSRAAGCKTAVYGIGLLLPAPSAIDGKLVNALFGITRGTTLQVAGQSC